MPINLNNKHIYLIIDNVDASIYWKDTEGHYLGCNKYMLKMAGIQDRSEIIGKKDCQLFWHDISNELEKIDKSVLLTGKYEGEETPVTANNDRRTFHTTKTILFDDKNNVIGIIGISVDITELKKAKEAAEAANQAKSEFLRNMEHQLRTPFSGVYSMVELLASDETDLKKKELLEITYQSAKEFLELLNDIIDFSRNQTESTIVLDKKFDLQELIKKAITMQRAAATAKHLKLIQKYPANIPSIWISDPKRIQRIILNLLSNAIKFSIKGTITIKVKLAKNIDEKRSIIQIFVTDMGIGIPADKQDLIYEKFYRVSPANHNKYTGAGLGLHVVK